MKQMTKTEIIEDLGTLIDFFHEQTGGAAPLSMIQVKAMLENSEIGPQAQWIPDDGTGALIAFKAWQCSGCGKWTRLDDYFKKCPYQYCPHCGRPMENLPDENEFEDEDYE